MQKGYLNQYAKTNRKLFPSICSRNNPDSTIIKLRQQTEQSLMMEIKDIDASLKDKTFSCRQGHLFSSEITDKVITELHNYIKKPTIIMEDGFSLWQNSIANETATFSEGKRLTTKLETFNERLVNLSMNNVFDYDVKKFHEITKGNKQRWSLLKRVYDNSTIDNTCLSKIEERSFGNETRKVRNSHISITDSTLSTLENQSKRKSSSPQQSNIETFSPISHLKEKINESYNTSRIKALRYKNDSFNKLLTEAKEFTNPEQEMPQISKHDIKSMLRKEGEKLVFIWIPPSTYPQFYGMFTYAGYKKMPICKLKKYFFFRRSLSIRFFNSILEEISNREGRIIEGLEIVTNRGEYIKVYEPIGWKMRSMEPNDKLRIRFMGEIK